MLSSFWNGVKIGADRELSRAPSFYSALWVAFIIFMLFFWR